MDCVTVDMARKELAVKIANFRKTWKKKTCCIKPNWDNNKRRMMMFYYEMTKLHAVIICGKVS